MSAPLTGSLRAEMRVGASGYRCRHEGAENGSGCQKKDLEVEPERVVLDVIVVPLRTICEGRPASQALHLSPAGNASLDPVAVAVAIHRALEALDELRPLGARPDQAHLA